MKMHYMNVSTQMQSHVRQGWPSPSRPTNFVLKNINKKSYLLEYQNELAVIVYFYIKSLQNFNDLEFQGSTQICQVQEKDLILMYCAFQFDFNCHVWLLTSSCWKGIPSTKGIQVPFLISPKFIFLSFCSPLNSWLCPCQQTCCIFGNVILSMRQRWKI